MTNDEITETAIGAIDFLDKVIDQAGLWLDHPESLNLNRSEVRLGIDATNAKLKFLSLIAHMNFSAAEFGEEA